MYAVSTTLSRSTAIAAALHVAVVVALLRVGPRVEPTASLDVAPLELEIWASPEAPPEAIAIAIEPGAARDVTAAKREPSGRANGEPGAKPGGEVAPEAAISGDIATAPAPASSAAMPPGDDDREARGRAAVASLFAGKLSPGPMAPAAPESSVAPALPEVSKDRAGEVVRDLLDAHDSAIGVGFGGPVATAAHQASLSSSAPQTGDATLEAIADRSGAVIDVHVVSGMPSPNAWASVASATLAGLRSQRLRVGGRGASVVVKVEAKVRLPSGANSGLERKGAGAQFDLADIGAVKLRVVSARVISERRQ